MDIFFFFFTVPWFYILIGVLAGIVFLLGVVIVVYQCYKRKIPDEESLRINTALQIGFTEGNIKRNGNQKTTRSPNASEKSYGISDFPWLSKAGKGKSQEKNEKSPKDGKDPNDKSYVSSTESDKAVSSQEKDKSMIEKCINDKNISAKLGQLHFTVEYEEAKSVLKVTIMKAVALPPKSTTTETADPYVKLHLLPEKKQRVKTRVLRKTLNPVYDEVFSFYGIDPKQIHALSLHFIILSFDRYSRDEIIGEVLHPLADEDIGQKNVAICKNIAPRHVKVR